MDRPFLYPSFSHLADPAIIIQHDRPQNAYRERCPHFPDIW